MRNWLCVILLAAAVLSLTGGCARAPAEATPTISGLIIITPTDSPASPTATLVGYPPPTAIAQIVPTLPTPYPAIPQNTPVAPLEQTTTPETVIASPTATPAIPTATFNPIPSSSSEYPAPAISPTSTEGAAAPTSPIYPGVVASSTPAPPIAYPVPGSATPSSLITVMPTPTATVSSTPPVIPEEIPPVPAVTPPPPGSLVRIWYSWSPEQVQVLDDLIDAFQDLYPGIRFEITNFPQADLRRRYETAAYNGGGPGLLFAPAVWGPAYYDTGLIRDLSPYASEDFLDGINPAALGTSLYKGALISLPVSEQGVVLYRNLGLIPTEAETFDQLIIAARSATRAGNLGAYFDRGAFFSAGNLGGLGGTVMDLSQNPTFNSPAGLAWLNLLEEYDVAGAVGLNTNRDLDLFTKGRIGYIIEGTWQIDSLVLALGEENLAIDPWPAFESGHLSGFVQADSVYLNPNIRPDDLSAALLFMGYLLTPDVQQALAEIGMIPVSLDADPRSLHIAQAANALAGGSAYPPVANPRVLRAYWEGLELAINEVFTRRIDPQDALIHAEDLVRERLSEISP